MKPKPFRIFRVGTHTDSAGQQTTFTREQLEATVKAYNEGDWRAPMVVGHPKGAAPAYGWVGKMRVDEAGEVIVDDVEKLNPDFAELMQAGAYRNRSASWYAPDHPNNPTPGVWQLRHLGMLGAQPPALKGLGDVEFHDAEGLTVDFSDEETEWSIAAMWRSMLTLIRNARESIIARDGIEAADKLIPSWQLDDATSQATRAEERARAAMATTSPAYSEGAGTTTPTQDPDMTLTPAEIAQLKAEAARATQLQADLDAASARAAAAEQQVTQYSEGQKAAQRAVAILDAKSALEPLVKSGKLLPAQLDQAAEFMVGLDDGTKSYDFGDATGENALTARGFFKALIEAGTKQVDYEDLTGNVSMPQNMKPEQLAQKAREYQDSMAEKGITVSSAQAVDAVIAGKAAA